MTCNRATQELDQLGMLVVGLVRLSNVEVGITVTSETVTDYLPRDEEWKLIKNDWGENEIADPYADDNCASKKLKNGQEYQGLVSAQRDSLSLGDFE